MGSVEEGTSDKGPEISGVVINFNAHAAFIEKIICIVEKSETSSCPLISS